MKKLFFTILGLLSVAGTFAQRIDFDLTSPSYKESTDLEPGYTHWGLGRIKGSATKTFQVVNDDDTCYVTITIANIDALQGNGLYSNYWKMGLRTDGYKLLGDAVYNGTVNSEGNWEEMTSGKSGIQLDITGLRTGDHTLMAYHSNINSIGSNIAPLYVSVNDNVVATAIKQISRGVKPSECPYSYIHFSVKDSTETIHIKYITDPADGVSYANTGVTINALVFDKPNPLTMAQDPYPENNDMHVDCDNKSILLRWSPAKITSKHHVFLGTSIEDQREIAVLNNADTCYTVNDIYSMNTYYWRIDEENAETHDITKGEQWTFHPRQLAFPGAEGYGRYAQGGRGGIVYHVTNLTNDMAPGSFLYGLVGLEGPRTIVFDVSGIITMSASPTEDIPSYFANPYVTIAGQTAPGKGICLRYCNISITNDCIVRHMRFKRGLGAYGVTGNAVGMNNNYTMMDHCTAAWGTDETLSTRGAKNITFQYSMIAEALGITGHKNYDWGTNHGYAATIDGMTGTYSHNMLVNCEGRNWSMGGGMSGDMHPIGRLDMFNNVCYNWYKRTTDGGCHMAQFVNNYYKMGPDTKLTILYSQDYENIGAEDGTCQAYVHGNIRENKDHSLTEDKLNDTYRYTLCNGASDPNTRTEYQYQTFVDKPFYESFATIHSAKDAFKIVTSTSGATMPCRDNQHKRVMNEAIKGTYTYTGSLSKIKGEIDTEADITGEANSGWEEWPEEHRAADFDTDQDGMPDWWEKVVGSDPAVANNNDDPDHDGWTLLEDYINFMAHPYVVVAPGESATFDCAQEFCGFTKSPQFSVSTDSKLFSASVSGSTITVKASTAGGVGTVNMTVKDGDGTEYTQPLGVAVTGDPTAINTITADNDYTPVKREFFTLDGKKVSRLTPHEVYIKKDTDTTGHTHTVKILKN